MRGHPKDYFLKLDWEIHLCDLHDVSYRSADELITAAAHDDEQRAPKSVAKNMAPWLFSRRFPRFRAVSCCFP